MENQKIETWAIVELVGNGKVAGMISEQTLYGKTFMAVLVPGGDSLTGFIRYYNPYLIYSITIVEKELAIKTAKSINLKVDDDFNFYV